MCKPLLQLNTREDKGWLRCISQADICLFVCVVGWLLCISKQIFLYEFTNMK